MQTIQSFVSSKFILFKLCIMITTVKKILTTRYITSINFKRIYLQLLARKSYTFRKHPVHLIKTNANK